MFKQVSKWWAVLNTCAGSTYSTGQVESWMDGRCVPVTLSTKRYCGCHNQDLCPVQIRQMQLIGKSTYCFSITPPERDSFV